VLETVRIANRDHQLPRPQGLRLAERDGGQVGRGDLENGHVRVWILPDQVGPVLAAVWQQHVNLGRVLDHVAVGQDQAVGSEDESGTRAGLRRGAPPMIGAAFTDVHRHHRWRDQLDSVDDGAGIGIQQQIIRR
jgi:hypothetical protein